MKKTIVIAAIISLAACTQGSEDKKDNQPQSPAYSKQVERQAPLDFSNEKISLSYAMGLDIAKSLKSMGMDIDKDAFMQAFDDFQNEKQQQLSATQASEAKQAFFKQRKLAEKK